MEITVKSWFWRAWVMALGLVAAATVSAQGPAFIRYDSRDGLPQSQVRVIMEDSRGFIWLGTEEGVARMGAGGMVAFDQANGSGTGRVRALLEDSEGAIWIALTGANLSRIRGSKVDFFDPRQGLPENNNYSLALDPQGRVLVGSTKGLYRLEAGTFHKVPLGVWDQYPVLCMARDSSNRVWMGSRKGRLAVWDGSALKEEHLPESAEQRDVWRLHLGPSGEIFALTRPGLFHKTPGGAWQPFPLEGYHGLPKFQDFCFAEDGTLLVSLGDEGFWMRSPAGTIRWWTSQDGLPQESINCGYKDRQGVTWIGSNGEGLFAQAVPALRTLSTKEILELGTVLAIEELPGKGLFLSGSRGLFKWDDAHGLSSHWTVKDGLPSNEINTLYPDGRGGLWVGTAKGLARWQDGHIAPRTFLGGARIFQVIRWHGNFVVGTEHGLVEMDPEGRVVRNHDVATTVGVQDVNVLIPDGDGILVGTERGIWRFDGVNLKQVHPQSPVADFQILSLYSPEPGDLWVGTARGAFHLSQGKWTQLKQDTGVPEFSVYFVGDAGHGIVAIGHGKGMSLVDPHGGITTLSQTLGLFANETNQQAFHLDAKGRFWFGVVGGVGVLDASEKLSLPTLKAPVILEASWPGGQSYLPISLDLPARVDSTEFDFEAGLPLSGVPLKYETFLEGFTKKWESVTAGHSVRFPRIPAGRYQFRVRASLDGKHWRECPPVQVRVRPTWYEHPLGRSLLGLLAIGAIVALVQWRTWRLSGAARALEAKVEDRTRSLDQRNQELEEANFKVQKLLEAKTAFSRMVVHDLRSPLTTMTLLAERMTLNAQERGEAPPEEMEMLQREANRLENLLQRLLDQARGETTGQAMSLAPANPHEVLSGLDEVLQLKAAAAGLDFDFQEEPAVAQARILADALAIQQIVLNLFGNALKCTTAPGHLGLRSRLEAGAWVLEVSDTGRGLEPSQMEHLFKPFTQVEVSDVTQGWGLGLSIVKSLVDIHQGLIEVESALGKGSTFRVLIPLIG